MSIPNGLMVVLFLFKFLWYIGCCCYWNRKVCIYCIWKTLILMDFLCFQYKETEVILVVLFLLFFDCQFLLWNCRSIHWKWFKTNNKWLTDYKLFLQSFRGSIMCDFTRDHTLLNGIYYIKISFILLCFMFNVLYLTGYCCALWLQGINIHVCIFIWHFTVSILLFLF